MSRATPSPSTLRARRALAAAAAAAWAVLAERADAARPLSTDDAQVQAPHQCELDSYAGAETARALPAAQAISVQLGCGVGARTSLGLAYARSFDDGDTPQTLALVGKTAVLSSGSDADPQAALAWGEVGRKVRGTAFRYDGWYATLVGQLPLGTWTVLGNLGATAEHAGRAVTLRWSAALTDTLPGDVVLGAEALGDDRHVGALLQAGGAVPVTGGLTANASWGLHTGREHDRIVTAGLTWGF